MPYLKELNDVIVSGLDPPSIHDLLNTYDQFDPKPLLEKAVAASERVAQYVNDAPRFRRPQTALANPFPSSNRSYSAPRRSSTGTSSAILDLNDFPSTNRGDRYSFIQRYPNGPTIDQNDYNLSPRPTHRTVSLPQNDRWLSIQVPKSETVDTSALDSVLHSPGRGSQPPHLQHPRAQDDLFVPRNYLDLESDYFFDDLMAKTTPNWKNSFANVRERFGGNPDFSDTDEDFRGAFATNESTVTIPINGRQAHFLSKSASQNTIDRHPHDR